MLDIVLFFITREEKVLQDQLVLLEKWVDQEVLDHRESAERLEILDTPVPTVCLEMMDHKDLLDPGCVFLLNLLFYFIIMSTKINF